MYRTKSFGLLIIITSAKRGNEMPIYIDDNNSNELYVRFDYSAERVRRIKMIPYHRWESAKKVWVLKNNSDTLKKLNEIFYDEELQINGRKSANSNQKVEDSEDRQGQTSIISASDPEALKDLAQHLRLKGYSFKTRKVYLGQLRRLLKYFNKPPEEISEKELKAYLFELLEDKKASHSYVNQTISAIKFLYNDVLKTGKVDFSLPRPKKQQKLPKVLSFDEVMQILNTVKNLKHIAILYLVYSAGLRVSEVVGLKITDIDTKRMQIRVVQGKGLKDRYTILSPIAYEKVKLYLDVYKPEVWLFSGANNKGHLTARSAENIFERALLNSRIGKDVSIHCLRHCFATHLYENGTDIRLIQQYLGHESSKTTEIYTHISDDLMRRVQSPLDQLMEKMKEQGLKF